MMKLLIVALLLLLPFGPRQPLASFDSAQGSPGRSRGTPAETLLEPAILKAMASADLALHTPTPTIIEGTDAAAGEIALVAPATRGIAADWAMKKLHGLIAAQQLPRPRLAIRFARSTDANPAAGTRTAIFVGNGEQKTLQVVRGAWSTAGIGDEVTETLAAHLAGPVETFAYREVGQPKWDAFGIATTSLIATHDGDGLIKGSSAAAAVVYFLATLPNDGAEALLSHLTVGAHARLAEDGRKAVAQMGSQQRAGADVLIMFGQAIEREQRRMRSFERFMPEPVDSMLRSRIADMERGITSVWTSMGITSSPFVAAAQRIRGRGGEDNRVVARTGPGRIEPVEPPTAFLKFDDPPAIVYELHNFIDGRRSISDIRDAVSAEFAPLPLPSVVDYFERLAKTGAISLR